MFSPRTDKNKNGCELRWLTRDLTDFYSSVNPSSAVSRPVAGSRSLVARDGGDAAAGSGAGPARPRSAAVRSDPSAPRPARREPAGTLALHSQQARGGDA